MLTILSSSWLKLVYFRQLLLAAVLNIETSRKHPLVRGTDYAGNRRTWQRPSRECCVWYPNSGCVTCVNQLTTCLLFYKCCDADDAAAKLTRLVLNISMAMAPVALATFFLDIIVERFLGTRFTGCVRSSMTLGEFAGIGFIVAVAIPACGYYGAKHKDRGLLCERPALLAPVALLLTCLPFFAAWFWACSACFICLPLPTVPHMPHHLHRSDVCDSFLHQCHCAVRH